MSSTDDFIDETLANIPPAEFDFTMVPLDPFTTDVARRIYTMEEVGRMYGMTGAQALELAKRPEVFRIIREKHSKWNSSENAGVKLQVLSQITMVENLPTLGGIIADDKAPITSRLEAAKIVGRAAGDPPKEPNVIGGPTAAQFAVNIYLGGRKETITTVVQEALEHEGEAA